MSILNYSALDSQQFKCSAARCGKQFVRGGVIVYCNYTRPHLQHDSCHLDTYVPCEVCAQLDHGREVRLQCDTFCPPDYCFFCNEYFERRQKYKRCKNGHAYHDHDSCSMMRNVCNECNQRDPSKFEPLSYYVNGQAVCASTSAPILAFMRSMPPPSDESAQSQSQSRRRTCKRSRATASDDKALNNDQDDNADDEGESEAEEEDCEKETEERQVKQPKRKKAKKEGKQASLAADVVDSAKQISNHLVHRAAPPPAPALQSAQPQPALVVPKRRQSRANLDPLTCSCKDRRPKWIWPNGTPAARCYECLKRQRNQKGQAKRALESNRNDPGFQARIAEMLAAQQQAAVWLITVDWFVVLDKITLL